jgi:hypothetical protein
MPCCQRTRMMGRQWWRLLLLGGESVNWWICLGNSALSKQAKMASMTSTAILLAHWGLFASNFPSGILKTLGWIQKDWACSQSLEAGDSCSSETRFLKSSAFAHPMNSSIVGSHPSSPDASEVLVVHAGSKKRLTAWSMFKDLKGGNASTPRCQ